MDNRLRGQILLLVGWDGWAQKLLGLQKEPTLSPGLQARWQQEHSEVPLGAEPWGGWGMRASLHKASPCHSCCADTKCISADVSVKCLEHNNQ